MKKYLLIHKMKFIISVKKFHTRIKINFNLIQLKLNILKQKIESKFIQKNMKMRYLFKIK